MVQIHPGPLAELHEPLEVIPLSGSRSSVRHRSGSPSRRRSPCRHDPQPLHGVGQEVYSNPIFRRISPNRGSDLMGSHVGSLFRYWNRQPVLFVAVSSRAIAVSKSPSAT